MPPPSPSRESAPPPARPAVGTLLLPRIDGREVAAIFAGGAAGALARVAVSRALPAGAAAWPWATFAVNVAGAFLLGFFATRLQERLPPSTYRRPLLGTGLCGGLTTFSTMQVEAFDMIDAGRVLLAAAYLVSSFAAGFAAVWIATAAVRRVRRL
jgi:CrcB protein